MSDSKSALSASLEDYLEAIWVIQSRKKVTRVKNIAKELGVTTASVVVVSGFRGCLAMALRILSEASFSKTIVSSVLLHTPQS